MAAHEKEMHDCIICASALGTNGGTLTLLCGECYHKPDIESPIALNWYEGLHLSF